MSKSRTTNTIYNFISSVGGQLITILMQFIVRTVFINTLGKSYLGINGLFSNILSMLSLAELGVGTAILFKLYDPIANEDKHRITILMKFYKKIYTLIGIVIAIIGICLIPFLHFLINDYERLGELGINVILIYLLYLFQSISSYLFWAYKSAIIKADQKEYFINLITYIFTILSGILQIIILCVFNNFELYVIVAVLNTILQNFAVSILANKKYSYINDKIDEKIETKEIKEIIKDCGALFLYKLNGVVLKATDNIIISMFLGLEMVGVYSNYYILYTTINTVFSKVFDSVTHSLGNLHTTHDYKNEYKVFKSTNIISVILGSTAGIGILCVADEFISAWIGKEWMIMQPFALLMGIELYTLSMRVVMSRYRNAMGLFQQSKYRPLAGMIINLIVSIILVKYWGICGVLVGTIVADWTTMMWFDPIIIHKYGFKNNYSVKRYYLKNLKYIVITVCIGIIDWLICSNVFVGLGWLSVVIHAGICGITVPLALIIPSLKTEEGIYLKELIFRYLKKIKK